MSKFESRLDTAGSEFQANAARMRALVDDLERQVSEVQKGGGLACGKEAHG